MPFKTEARPYTYLIAYCTADGKTTPSPKVLERGREAFTQFALAGLQDPLELRVKVHRLRAAVDAVRNLLAFERQGWYYIHRSNLTLYG